MFPGQRGSGPGKAVNALRNIAADMHIAKSLRSIGDKKTASFYSKRAKERLKSLPTWARW